MDNVFFAFRLGKIHRDRNLMLPIDRLSIFVKNLLIITLSIDKLHFLLHFRQMGDYFMKINNKFILLTIYCISISLLKTDAMENKHYYSNYQNASPLLTIVKPDGESILWDRKDNQRLSDLRKELKVAGIIEDKDMFNGVLAIKEPQWTVGMLIINNTIAFRPRVKQSHQEIFNQYQITSSETHYFFGLTDTAAKELANCIRMIKSTEHNITYYEEEVKQNLKYSQTAACQVGRDNYRRYYQEDTKTLANEKALHQKAKQDFKRITGLDYKK